MFKLQITNYKLHNSGFTLIEMIVVIFIIALGMLGVISLVNQSIQVEYINKNMIIASQLAQEGLELVRNKRDINWLKKEDWKYSSTTGLNFDIIQDGTYSVSYNGTINSTPSDINGARAKLYLTAANYYTHTITTNPTPFSRLITVGNESAASTSVSCLVQWKRGSNVYNFTAQTVLNDWR